ncbi:IS4 family transposase [Ralstonia sp.]|uniref:IS4 family transposase n=1 Tax=Ralstonia sp. TaxID=54061 RepID=UPI00397B8CD5
MAHHNTVFAQLLRLLPRHRFDALAGEHHHGCKLRSINRWSQCVALMLGQLSGRGSLRDLIDNMSAQGRRLYHLGCRRVTRSTLARVNEQQPHTLYEALFGELYARCQSQSRGHRFRFRNKLYSLDSTLIDLSLAIFPWADFNRGKAAMKLHVGLDHSGYLPAFVTVTPSKTGDVEAARTLNLPRGSIVVFDRGYNSYSWFKSLNDRGIGFVTRPHRDMDATVTERRDIVAGSGVLADQTIRLNAKKPRQLGVKPLRRIRFYDADTGRSYTFVTNIWHLAATTIAAIYKERWQVELFFKWIKQNLKIRAFLGTSRNAVLTQIWIALCTYLLLAWLKFMARLGWSLQQMLRVLQLNLFLRRDLFALLRGDPDPAGEQSPPPQLALV